MTHRIPRPSRVPWTAAACGALLVGCGGRTGVLEDARADAGATLDGGSPSASLEGGPDATPTFPTGAYACSSTLSATGTYQGTHFESVAGGDGTLTVTQSGDVVTAAYTGDLFVSGTLRFDATTDSTAEPAASGQTLTFTCFSPFGGTPPPQTLAVTSGTLTMDGSTLFLSATGMAQPATPTPTACDGLSIPVTLTCTLKQ